MKLLTTLSSLIIVAMLIGCGAGTGEKVETDKKAAVKPQQVLVKTQKLQWTPIGDGTGKGVNICLTYNGASNVDFSVIDTTSKSPLASIAGLNKESVTVELQCSQRSGILGLEVWETDAGPFGKALTNDLDLSGVQANKVDGKIGGTEKAPFFIGIEDARTFTKCKVPSIISDMSMQKDSSFPIIRLNFNSTSTLLLVSSDTEQPTKNNNWCLGDPKTPIWGCDFEFNGIDSCDYNNGCIKNITVK